MQSSACCWYSEIFFIDPLSVAGFNANAAQLPVCTVTFSRSDFEMQRFESRRLSQPVSLQRVTYEDRSKTARHREVAQTPAAERDVLDIDRSGSHELLHREMRNGHDDEMAIVQRTGGRPKRCCGNSDGV